MCVPATLDITAVSLNIPPHGENTQETHVQLRMTLSTTDLRVWEKSKTRQALSMRAHCAEVQVSIS